MHGEDPRLLQESCSASKLCREVAIIMKPVLLSALGGGQVLSSLLLSDTPFLADLLQMGSLGVRYPKMLSFLLGFQNHHAFTLGAPLPQGRLTGHNLPAIPPCT